MPANSHNDSDTRPDPPQEHVPSSPYGPHGEQIDDSSGGADSSPYESMSSEERIELQKRRRREQG